MTNIDNLVKIQKEQSVTYESLPGFVAKYRIDPDMNLTLLSANARFMEYFGEEGESSPLYQRNIDVNMEIILKYGEEIRKEMCIRDSRRPALAQWTDGDVFYW